MNNLSLYCLIQKKLVSACACVHLTVYGLLHPLQSCIGSIHVQAKVIKLFLAQLMVFGLLFKHFTAQYLNTTKSRAYMNFCSLTNCQRNALLRVKMFEDTDRLIKSPHMSWPCSQQILIYHEERVLYYELIVQDGYKISGIFPHCSKY